jgi:hypothetical protein
VDDFTHRRPYTVLGEDTLRLVLHQVHDCGPSLACSSLALYELGRGRLRCGGHGRRRVPSG